MSSQFDHSGSAWADISLLRHLECQLPRAKYHVAMGSCNIVAVRAQQAPTGGQVVVMLASAINLQYLKKSSSRYRRFGLASK